MEAVKKVENTLSGFFKDVPGLPASAKESLVKIGPWLALIFGVLQLLAAWWLWQLAQIAENLGTFTNNLSVYYSGQPVGLTAVDRTMIYVGLIVLVVDAVILLMAYPQLKKRTRRGWDLLFLAALVNLVYALMTIFIEGRGIGAAIASLLGSAIGFYVLFQVREKYSHGKK